MGGLVELRQVYSSAVNSTSLVTEVDQRDRAPIRVPW